jgi:acyl-CoA synthetase (AMP-forming)/AMP-acid ligase II
MTFAQASTDRLNVADRLRTMAQAMPEAVAVAEPLRRDRGGRRQYRQLTFAQLDADADRLARGLIRLGARPAMRLALLVPPGIDFVALVFALFRSGAITVLIDPGMGRRNLIESLAEVCPDGFVAVPKAHLARQLFSRRFPAAGLNVTVAGRWPRSGPTIDRLRSMGEAHQVALPVTRARDPAAIIFTSGSTGPAKGVLYQHGNFDAQVTQIRDRYGIRAGEIDLPGFPLFGLINAAMGVTTVIPDMDPSRPALVDPRKIVAAVHQWNVTQAFGSPAIWDRVGRYCEAKQIRLPSLRRVLSAGAPVPAHVLRRMVAAIHSDGDVHTPYGATEALPVASIAARTVLSETTARTEQGGGVCVGGRFDGIDWRVIRPVAGPIATLADAEPLSQGEIGELIVHGAQVTPQYVTCQQWNPRSKIAGPDGLWHRMGDLGYLDEHDRFWFCGRVAQRVTTTAGPLDTACCEAIFNVHPEINRTALVAVGDVPAQRPVLVVEPLPENWPRTHARRQKLQRELAELAVSNRLTASIDRFLLRRKLPVDVRHNAKINREELAKWATGQLQ